MIHQHTAEFLHTIKTTYLAAVDDDADERRVVGAHTSHCVMKLVCKQLDLATREPDERDEGLLEVE